ncbi:MAG: DUF4391 domain-containing protein [Candidatus Nomurabacteria bacterium]|jgi:hypothetical protein|nr:DUF4391 domain-containing protein [Candidatus Nomurabacteria bacterium]
MIELPASTIVNRFVPKESFYKHAAFTPKLREIFTDEIEKITWTHKISPATLPVESSPDYPEIDIFHIKLKTSDLNQKAIELIDKNIPRPVLFILERPTGYKKAIIAAKSGKTINHHFASDWAKEQKIAPTGRTMKALYLSIISHLDEKVNIQGETTPEKEIENAKLRKELEAKIAKLTTEIAKEPAINKRQSLAKKRHELEQKLQTL